MTTSFSVKKALDPLECLESTVLAGHYPRLFRGVEPLQNTVCSGSYEAQQVLLNGGIGAPCITHHHFKIRRNDIIDALFNLRIKVLDVDRAGNKYSCR